MVFSSYSFIILFFLFLPTYYLTKDKLSKFILVFAFSVIFLSYYGERHILLAVFAALISFPALIYSQKYFFRITILAIISILIVFKYQEFLGIKSFLNFLFIYFPVEFPTDLYEKLFLVLPFGISFYSFQIIGALIDQKKLKLRIKFTDWILYVIFFPQLIAGPIVRIRSLISQFNQGAKLRIRNISIGMQLFAVGFGKKILIADPLSSVSAYIWDNPNEYNGIALFIAIISFYFQIYFDFSGYTDMGRGCARLIGFRLPINFRNPYYATNPNQFFERWHVSLSSWIRDFVYLPLSVLLTRRYGLKIGFKNVSYISAFIAMFIFGIWHGAGWNFFMYAIATGVMVALWLPITEVIKIKSFYKKLFGFIWVQGLFIISLIFFRAPDIDTGFFMISNVFKASGYSYSGSIFFVFAAGLIAYLLQFLDAYILKNRNFAKKVSILRTKLYGAFLWVFIFLVILSFKIGIDGGPEMISVVDDLGGAFIYFEF